MKMIMNLKDLHQKCLEVYKKHNWYEDGDYWLVGIRFENKDREIGEICENSKDNPDRFDERDFPEYGTPEYDEMPELDGTSAWTFEELNSLFPDEDKEINVKKYFGEHAYIIGGDYEAEHPNPDHNEVVIKDAVVLEKLW